MTPELRPSFVSIHRTDPSLLIDEASGTVTPDDYDQISPYGEVYIRHNRGIAFAIEGDYSRVHIGVKSPTGRGFTLLVNGEPLKDANGEALKIAHVAEMYYDITDYIDGNRIALTCLAENGSEEPMLSLVTLKLIPAISDGTGISPTVVASAELVDFVEAICFGVMGDVDRDGTVTLTDALLAMRCALDASALDAYTALRADFDRDGVITLIDAILIMRAALSGE